MPEQARHPKGNPKGGQFASKGGGGGGAGGSIEDRRAAGAEDYLSAAERASAAIRAQGEDQEPERELGSEVHDDEYWSKTTDDQGRERLSNAEAETVAKWSDNGQGPIRDSLHAGNPTTEALEFADAIDALPAHQGIVYRGVSGPPSRYGMTEGAEVELPKHSSWSASRDVAIDFTDIEARGGGTVFVVKAGKTGTKFANINPWAPEENDWGKEVVSKPGRFRVKKIRRGETTNYTMVNPFFDVKDRSRSTTGLTIVELESIG